MRLLVILALTLNIGIVNSCSTFWRVYIYNQSSSVLHFEKVKGDVGVDDFHPQREQFAAKTNGYFHIVTCHHDDSSAHIHIFKQTPGGGHASKYSCDIHVKGSRSSVEETGGSPPILVVTTAKQYSLQGSIAELKSSNGENNICCTAGDAGPNDSGTITIKDCK
jgi:hypothetical protein